MLFSRSIVFLLRQSIIIIIIIIIIMNFIKVSCLIAQTIDVVAVQ